MKTPTTRRRAFALAPLLAALALAVGFSPAFVAVSAHAAPTTVSAADDQLIAEYRTMQAETGQWILDNVDPSTGLGVEWKALGLARNRTPGAEQWLATYYDSLVDDVVTANGNLGAATEYERIILAVTAIGKNPADVGGHNLLEGLADLDKMQLSNQRIFGLLALDSKNYEIPEVEGVTNPTTRQALVDLTLDAEIDGGGWAFFGNTPDPDMTGMTMQALAPYKDQPEVAAALERGVGVLADIQKDSGAFASFNETVESTVQVIAALTPLGIDPDTDPRFIKDASAASAVTNFYIDGGGFWFNTPSETRNSMSTEQGFYGVADFLRFVDGENSLYDMTDVEDSHDRTTPTLSATSAASAFGKPVLVTVSISGGATGQVTTTAAGRKVSAAVQNGSATLRVPARVIAPGSHRLDVKYAGSEQFLPVSGVAQVRVTKAPTTVRIAPQKWRVKRGQKAVFRIKVNAAGVTPKGRVRVAFNGNKAAAPLNANGVAVVRVPVKKLAVPGKRAVVATYLGAPRMTKAVKKTQKVITITK